MKGDICCIEGVPEGAVAGVVVGESDNLVEVAACVELLHCP